MLVGEGGLPETDFILANGLVHPLSTGFIVLSATTMGYVGVELRVTEHAPRPELDAYDDISEISAVMPTGQVNFETFEDGADELNDCGAGITGSIRVRVSVRGRDVRQGELSLETAEQYLVEMWPAPPAAPQDLIQRDELGRNYRLGFLA